MTEIAAYSEFYRLGDALKHGYREEQKVEHNNNIIGFEPGRGFTDAERARGKLGLAASRAVTKRLLRLHSVVYLRLLNEERVARGLDPVKRTKSTRIGRKEMERLAKLAVEAGLS